MAIGVSCNFSSRNCAVTTISSSTPDVSCSAAAAGVDVLSSAKAAAPQPNVPRPAMPSLRHVDWSQCHDDVSIQYPPRFGTPELVRQAMQTCNSPEPLPPRVATARCGAQLPLLRISGRNMLRRTRLERNELSHQSAMPTVRFFTTPVNPADGRAAYCDLAAGLSRSSCWWAR